jgi:signal transduction histidine kinase
VLVTLAIAAIFNPVRVRLQRRVNRLLYGDRSDVVRAASSVIAQLGQEAERPADVLPGICQALRLPYAELSGPDGIVGSHGAKPERLERFPLRHGGEVLGELTVGVRSGQARLDRADRTVLELVSVPLGVALRAEALSAAVQRSRRRIVAAREEERRRLRRDLHDGLGPVLTGVAFRADAVISLAEVDPPRVRALAEDIRADVTGAISDVRRLIYQLRPAALEEVGLVEAVRRYAERLDRRADGTPLAVEVNADPELPTLTAAIELAAYRIAAEALTNVARHSTATRAEVRMETDGGDLVLRVADDGAISAATEALAPWSAGVGLRSMHERAAELGGTVLAEPTDLGGRVFVRLPREA